MTQKLYEICQRCGMKALANKLGSNVIDTPNFGYEFEIVIGRTNYKFLSRTNFPHYENKYDLFIYKDGVRMRELNIKFSDWGIVSAYKSGKKINNLHNKSFGTLELNFITINL